MKVFQIVGGMCHWLTPYKSVGETVGKYPADCLFVEAPDYVHESWGYQEKDADGNDIPLEERFIRPTPPEGWLYDEATGTFYPEEELGNRLEKAQEIKQSENKSRFAEFLSTHPLTWVDGKTYGVTLEDQTEIQLNLQQYKLQVEAGVENPVLEWHASHEPCTAWEYDDLVALSVAISNYIYPWFQKMNDYKSAIYATESLEELASVNIVYEEESKAEEADATEVEEA